MNRWVNPSHPRNLQNATVLLYINAALALFDGLTGSGLSQLGLLTIVGALGAANMVNDKKWAYYLSAFAAVFPLALLALLVVTGKASLGFASVIYLIFPIVLVVLMFAKDTREYVRIWFK